MKNILEQPTTEKNNKKTYMYFTKLIDYFINQYNYM